MRRMLHLLFGGFVLMGTLLTLTPGRALIDRLLFPDEATLDEGLNATIVLVQDTVAVVATASEAGLAFTADHPLEIIENADPEQIDELQNNYSLGDHSHSVLRPGYDDCDHWSNAFDDGWSASYGLAANSGHLSDDQRRLVLEAVREYWESLGYVLLQPTVDPDETDLSGFAIETEFGRVGIGFSPRRGTASVRATTVCLPPG